MIDQNSNWQKPKTLPPCNYLLSRCDLLLYKNGSTKLWFRELNNQHTTRCSHDRNCTAGGRQAVSIQLRWQTYCFSFAMDLYTWETARLSVMVLGKSPDAVWMQGLTCVVSVLNVVSLTAAAVTLLDFPTAIWAALNFYYHTVAPNIDLSPDCPCQRGHQGFEVCSPMSLNSNLKPKLVRSRVRHARNCSRKGQLLHIL